MKPNEIISAGGNVITYAMASTQTNEVLQTIEFILAIITSLMLIGYRVWRWYKDASEDGKIDKEEIDGLTKIIKDSSEKIKEEAEAKGRKDKHE